MKYNRVMLKLSGESLAGQSRTGIDDAKVQQTAKMIADIHALGIELSVVIGGGNFWRGRTNPHMDRVTADQIGMLATTMNAMTVADAVSKLKVDCRVLNAISMPTISEPYIQKKAIRYLENNTVLFFAGGTGSPFFSTDSGAALRAAEISADVVLKGTQVDGVYDKDPNKYADAKRYSEISLSEVMAKGLNVVDSTAAALCRDNNIPLIVFSIEDSNNVIRILKGENIGTIVNPQD